MASIILPILIMVFSVIIALIFVAVFLTLTRSHTLIIRDPLSRESYIEKRLMVEKNNSETHDREWHNVWWQKKFVVQEPPKESVDIGRKGKKFVEAYRITEDQFVWIVDKGMKIKRIQDPKTKEMKILMYDVDIKGNEKFIDTLKPFTAIQREVVINQYKKAHDKQAKRWTTEKIMALGALSILGIVIVCLVIFWGDAMQPMKEMQTQAAESNQRALRLLENIAKITSGDTSPAPQIFPGENQGGVVQPGEEPPKE